MKFLCNQEGIDINMVNNKIRKNNVLMGWHHLILLNLIKAQKSSIIWSLDFQKITKILIYIYIYIYKIENSRTINRNCVFDESSFFSQYNWKIQLLVTNHNHVLVLLYWINYKICKKIVERFYSLIYPQCIIYEFKNLFKLRHSGIIKVFDYNYRFLLHI